MNTMTVWKPFGDLTNDFFGRDFDSLLNDIYAKDKQYLNVQADLVDDIYVIKAEVPGLKEENLNISFEHDVVKIEAEYNEDDANVFRSGKYARSFTIRDVDADKATAELNDGILTVKLPKSEEKKARKIKIN